jgi:hypothetical protein
MDIDAASDGEQDDSRNKKAAARAHVEEEEYDYDSQGTEGFEVVPASNRV